MKRSASTKSWTLSKGRSKSEAGVIVDLEQPKMDHVHSHIEDILCSDDLNLLTLICGTQFGSETTSVLARSFLTMLRLKEPKLEEILIRRVLRKRIKTFCERQRDLSDILRDNSMSCMLISSFAHRDGRQYLLSALETPLLECFTLFGTEIPPGDVSSSQQRMKSACDTILTSILTTKHLIPPSIRMLALIIVEELAAEPPESSRKQDPLSAGMQSTLDPSTYNISRGNGSNSSSQLSAMLSSASERSHCHSDVTFEECNPPLPTGNGNQWSTTSTLQRLAGKCRSQELTRFSRRTSSFGS
ncbi:hypothetical protein M427DRAFT_275777 [Gonapodya prolifera JEL478]|uniref:Uncharacterized protein n=1 Tax=Gonapodya prolifera (strain JEL478) TaxID=1344416 RepID=A0A139AY29_GONPJ|nr:hypothetical protein M427DRAFT_275777 [Gonapodya prolifera JEL478]|eukprot:KXS21652.1 hypothetical protein M427DRAFT_275777 [Gonapodya prolifera JEL478]